MEKNSEYWEKRLASETWKTYNSLEEKNRELLEFYIDASESVKDELYRLAEKYSKDGVLSLSDMHKQNRLTELNGKFEKIIEDLGHSTKAFAKKNMQDGFKKVYADTAAGMGDLDFSMPNKKLMEKLMETPWRGDNFSGRLWKNQKKLAVSLNDILLTGLQQGKTAVEIAIMLHNRMGQGFNECHRLVRTETMHYLNDATLQRYKDADVKYVQILAAKDERTCDICGGYHEKVYPIEECVHVPLHANCRCTIIPVTDEKLIAEYEKKSGRKVTRKHVDIYEKGDTIKSKSMSVDLDEEIVKLQNEQRKLSNWGTYDEIVADFGSIDDFFDEDDPKGNLFKSIQQKIVSLKTSKREKIIDDIVNNVKKKEKMNIADAVNANPNYSKSSAYKNNCQRCVQAYELRRRGYDVIAKQQMGKEDSICWGSELFVPKGVKPSSVYTFKQTEKNIKEELYSAPDGARYSIYVSWKNGNNAHVFIAEKKNGIIHFVDPQSGNTHVESYFQQGKSRSFGFYRLDDKEIVADKETIAKIVEAN